ncbi:hypothetical protein B0H17DRAFT_1222266 [Mycena rosella]|uniref:Uncharacterized protein n=1 Tax=Mycena rosella TaxID=1033263 RepID=A0AAD7AYC1_MYCRO|nr:hypothetical protein B0H17DRAFT_1222266 [Mycena rosella]
MWIFAFHSTGEYGGDDGNRYGRCAILSHKCRANSAALMRRDLTQSHPALLVLTCARLECGIDIGVGVGGCLVARGARADFVLFFAQFCAGFLSFQAGGGSIFCAPLDAVVWG